MTIILITCNGSVVMVVNFLQWTDVYWR